MEHSRYDFIFAGFGLAGMSLLHAMGQYPAFKEKRVLVIDLDAKKDNDRTWSFWSEGIPELESIVHKSWRNGYVYDRQGQKIELELEKYRYFTIRGGDYYQLIHEHLNQFPNVTFVQDRIQTVDPDGTVHCDRGRFRGDLVFNSFFLRESMQPDDDTVFLWQHFKGWFVRTATPAFDPERFLLMDFRASHTDRSDFFYVLPFSQHTALIEFTEFSRDFYSQPEYNAKIRKYITDYLKLPEFEVVEEEFNAIPMTDALLGDLRTERVIRIGSMAGYIKASSGYCFTRTLEKNQALAREVMTTGKASPATVQSAGRFLAYDRAMLNLMASGKLHGWEMMPPLFRKLGGDKVFAFLDERTRFPDEVAVMATAPKKMAFIKFYLERGVRTLQNAFSRRQTTPGIQMIEQASAR
ncbi:MAG: lycopene cyclase family protein [Bacteroidota bacterium]